MVFCVNVKKKDNWHSPQYSMTCMNAFGLFPCILFMSQKMYVMFIILIFYSKCYIIPEIYASYCSLELAMLKTSQTVTLDTQCQL